MPLVSLSTLYLWENVVLAVRSEEAEISRANHSVHDQTRNRAIGGEFAHTLDDHNQSVPTSVRIGSLNRLSKTYLARVTAWSQVAQKHDQSGHKNGAKRYTGMRLP
jgi:hypothetical protein